MHTKASLKQFLKSSIAIQNTPSFASFDWPIAYLACGVQSSELSPQSPYHSNDPQGFLTCTIFAILPSEPFTVAVLMRLYACPLIRPYSASSSHSYWVSPDTPQAIIYYFLSASLRISQISVSSVV